MCEVNFKLRPWLHTDIDSLVRCANNPNVAGNMTDGFPSPYLRENAEAFIKMASAHDPMQIFAITVDGEAIGGIGLHLQTDIHRKNAEIGYWLAESYWGKGIVTRAIKEIVEYGFNTFEINRIFARPFGSNIASQNVLEKNGFVLEGKFIGVLFKNGEYLDELIYAVRRNN
jgi:RimJ/RimL family protein N-acetyltransferase